MNDLTKTRLQALFSAVKDNPELLRLHMELQTAVADEIEALSAGWRRYSRSDDSGFSSMAGRRVLERAWAADPKQTEMDLISADRRDLAGALGAWWAGESHRRGPAADDTMTDHELDEAVVDEYRQVFIEELMEERRWIDLITRAYRADPAQTEYDLVALGMRDMATDLGAVRVAEAYRQVQGAPAI